MRLFIDCEFSSYKGDLITHAGIFRPASPQLIRELPDHMRMITQ